MIHIVDNFTLLSPAKESAIMTKTPIETKAKDAVFAEILTTFQAFKETNDARLEEMERKASADVLLHDKLERLDRALHAQQAKIDHLALKSTRPGLHDDRGPEQADPERAQAWNAYLRKGDESAVARLEMKAAHLQLGSDSQGGYVAPPELDRLIETRLAASSPMRAIAQIRQTAAHVFRKPVSLGANAAWTAEAGARAQTDAPSLALLEFPAAELFAMPAATQTLLDDAFIDLDQWLADEVDIAFSAQEGAAFVSGDGVNKPKGFLSYEIVPEAAHQWGKIGAIHTGVAGDFAPGNPADAIINLAYAPKAQFRTQGRFVMNRKTLAAVRRLKDNAGNYLWTPGLGADASNLLGYPVTEIEDMPDIAPNAPAIAFGDFGRFYLIVDRQGARVLRDPFSAKPFVLFYTTKRVGGGVQNFDAVKLLRFAVN